MQFMGSSEGLAELDRLAADDCCRRVGRLARSCRGNHRRPVVARHLAAQNPAQRHAAQVGRRANRRVSLELARVEAG